MKDFFLFAILILTINISSFAQSLSYELDKIREIKMLESTREDVKRILTEYEHDADEYEYYSQDFSTKNVEIEITFAKGDCSDNAEKWNVPEWTVTKIEITTEDKIKIKDFGFDFSKYNKETEEDNLPEFYRYHNEDEGIIFEIRNDEVSEIIIYPTESKFGSLCNNETTEEIISGEKKISDLIYEPIYCPPPARVTNITLSSNEIISCKKSAKNKKCSENNAKISVMTEANDTENDQLVYNYTVSAGKIIGSGEKVVWDLSGAAPGEYTITAGVDDGCGICGETKTQTVEVK